MNQRIRKKHYKRNQIALFNDYGHIMKSKDFILGDYWYNHNGTSAFRINEQGVRYEVYFALRKMV